MAESNELPPTASSRAQLMREREKLKKMRGAVFGKPHPCEDFDKENLKDEVPHGP